VKRIGGVLKNSPFHSYEPHRGKITRIVNGINLPNRNNSAGLISIVIKKDPRIVV
jgi:hypothetical protein